MLSKWLFIFLSLNFAGTILAVRSKQLSAITEDNWKVLLDGEWMVEFFAPWCPACKDLSKTWSSFADWSRDLNINVADVDVTVAPGLSGRFLVTALPTIFHVKDGVFRIYQGARDKEEFMKFIEDKQWTSVEPIATWKHPDSVQMSVVAAFFRLSMHVRDLHTHLTEAKGWPVWASYAAFGSATLLLGCALGFCIVCVIDAVFPAASPAPPTKSGGDKKQKSDKKGGKKENKKGKAKESDNEEETQTGDENDSQKHSQTTDDESADESGARQRRKEKGKK